MSQYTEVRDLVTVSTLYRALCTYYTFACFLPLFAAALSSLFAAVHRAVFAAVCRCSSRRVRRCSPLFIALCSPCAVPLLAVCLPLFIALPFVVCRVSSRPAPLRNDRGPWLPEAWISLPP